MTDQIRLIVALALLVAVVMWVLLVDEPEHPENVSRPHGSEDGSESAHPSNIERRR